MMAEYKYRITERIGGFFFGVMSDSPPKGDICADETADRISDISQTFSSLSEMLNG
jgi:hypothetical protein